MSEVFCLFAALLTFEFSQAKSIGVIRSSCIMGIFIIVVAPLHLQALLYGATFVGMCSAEKFTRVQVSVGAIFYAYIYLFFSLYFDGLGGKLGMSAFLAVVLIYSANKVMMKLKYRLEKG